MNLTFLETHVLY
jgi:hypothetical protein